jgi:hypothetical protein
LKNHFLSVCNVFYLLLLFLAIIIKRFPIRFKPDKNGKKHVSNVNVLSGRITACIYNRHAVTNKMRAQGLNMDTTRPESRVTQTLRAPHPTESYCCVVETRALSTVLFDVRQRVRDISYVGNGCKFSLYVNIYYSGEETVYRTLKPIQVYIFWRIKKRNKSLRRPYRCCYYNYYYFTSYTSKTCQFRTILYTYHVH